ncbi:MAG: hypothetical protein AAB487_03050 [Patescibacteria group bacterium]
MKFKKIFPLLFAVVILFFAFFSFSLSAMAQIYFPTSAEIGLPDPAGGVKGILLNFMNWLLALFGLIAIIAFVISGTQYLTAAGSEKVLETAKRNMTYSIIGVIVALAAFVIIKAIDTALRMGALF